MPRRIGKSPKENRRYTTMKKLISLVLALMMLFA